MRSARPAACSPRRGGLRFDGIEVAGCATLLLRADHPAPSMIVSLHVATGAAAGVLTGSPLRALLLGPFVHLAGDRVPHRDNADYEFETRSGIALIALLALRRGIFDAATIGAAAASAPDLEHVFPSLRPGGKKLFHRPGWHRSGAFGVNAQLLLAGAILGLLIAPRRHRPTRARSTPPLL